MKRNLILLAVCVLIALFYFWDTERVEKQEEQEEKEKILIALDEEEVKEVTIHRPQTVLKGVKEGEQWKLVEPLQAKGDASTWNNIAQTIAGGKRERVIEEQPEDLSIFGLADSSLQVTLAGIDGATATTLVFGKETPVSGKYYAMIEGTSDVVTVPSYWQNISSKNLYDLRDKTILELETDQVQKVEIAHATHVIALERQNEKDWVLTKPVQAHAQESAVRELVNKLKNGKIKQFIEEKPDIPAVYGMDKPKYILTFWQGDDPTANLSAQTLIIGSTSEETDNYYAKHGSKENIFAIEPDVLEKVPQSVENLRLKKLTSIRSWETRYVKVVSAGETIIEATKPEGEWTLLQPKEGKADYNAMSTAVRSIVDLEAKQFADGQVDFSQPNISIELKSEEQSLSIPIVIQDATGETKHYFAQRKDPIEVLQLSSADIENMLADLRNVELDATEEPTPTPEVTSQGTDNE
ncbi:DUF4340 domain-containing protein [bacterium]|nr:DUF4340 domain-containing protein [bacterium]